MIDLVGVLAPGVGRASGVSQSSLARFGADATLSSGSGTFVALAAAVDKMLLAAKAGGRVDSVQTAIAAGEVPSEMKDPPANTAGAYYRTAFWLALASRIAVTRAAAAGSSGAGGVFFQKAAVVLLDRAQKDRATAAALVDSAMSPLVFSWLSTSRDLQATSGVLARAADLAKGSEILEVAAELVRLSAPAAIAAKQAAVEDSSGIRALSKQAATAVLGPERVAEVEALGAKSVAFLESTRLSYTDAELVQAKRVLGLYDQIRAKTALLERFRTSDVPMSTKAKNTLESCKQYLVTLAQPVDLAKRTLSWMGSGNRTGRRDEVVGIAPVVVAAGAGWTVGEIVLVIVVVSVVAAIIALAAFSAMSYAKYADAAEAVEETIQAALRCANDPNSTPETRATCARVAEEAERNRPKPPADPLEGFGNLLWAGAAILGVGVLAYVAAPFLAEAGKTGASELSALRQDRARSRLVSRTPETEKDAWLDTDGRPMLLASEDA